MAMAGDRLVFIQFSYVLKGLLNEVNDPTRLISVLDPETGKVSAVYGLSGAENDANIAACADSPYDFLFVGTDENSRLKLVRYSP